MGDSSVSTCVKSPKSWAADRRVNSLAALQDAALQTAVEADSADAETVCSQSTVGLSVASDA